VGCCLVLAHYVRGERAKVHVDCVQTVDVQIALVHHVVVGAVVLGQIDWLTLGAMAMAHLVHTHLVAWDHSVHKHARVIVHPLSSPLIGVVVHVHTGVVTRLGH
jgi:hypothetical protein